VSDGLTSGRLLARNAAINLLSPVLPALLALITIPVLLRELGTARYGVLSLVLVVVGYFGLFDLGLSRALTQVVAQRLGSGEKEDLAGLVWTALSVTVMLGLAASVVVGLLAPWLVQGTLQIPADLQRDSLHAFYWLALSLPFVIGSDGLIGILAAHQRFGLVNAVTVPMGALTLLAPLLVLQFAPNLASAVAAITLVRVAGFFAYLGVCLAVFPFLRHAVVPDRSLVRPLLRFGGWMTVSNVISPLMVSLDRFLIGALLSMAAVTYYSTAYEVVTKLWIIPGSLVATLFPAFATTFKGNHQYTATLFERGFRVVFLLVFPFVLILVILAPEALQIWLGAEFARNSTVVLRWLAVGVFINCLAHVPFAAIQAIGRPDLTAKLHALELPLYLAVLWGLLHVRGIEGAAIAWTLRVTVDAAALFALSARYLAIPRAALVRALVALVSALVVLGIGSRFEYLPVKVAFLLAALVAFSVFGWNHVMDAAGRNLIRAILAPLRSRSASV
jgi:O-antigen/teichoic acid export membrane protein